MIKLKYPISFLIVIFLTMPAAILQAQTTDTPAALNLSLQEIQEYALENNFDIKNTELDIEIAKKRKWETTAIGLPNVSGSVQYQNYPNIPTQLMPNFITPAVVGINRGLFGLTPIATPPEMGKIPVQFGSKHNATFGFSVSQLVFSGEYIVGLKAAGIYLELSKTANSRKKEEVIETVTNTYYLILIANESIKAMTDLYGGIEKLKSETSALVDAGFADKTDIRQIELNLKNTENGINSLKQQNELLYRLLKFQAGIDYNTPLNLTSGLDSVVLEIESGVLNNAKYDVYSDNGYRLLQVQETLTKMDLLREKSTVLPQLSAFYRYNKKIMQDEMDFFSEDAKWFPTSLWGLTLNVPIFSSGGRWARIQQKKLAYQQIMNTKEQTRTAMQIDFQQTKSNYITSYNNFKNSETSKQLSQDVYNNTLLKYKTGTLSGLELTQAQMQYFTSVGQYYKNLGELIGHHIKLKRMLKKLKTEE